MKCLLVGVEDPVLTFPYFMEGFISHLFMSAPLDRVPGSSRFEHIWFNLAQKELK